MIRIDWIKNFVIDFIYKRRDPGTGGIKTIASPWCRAKSTTDINHERFLGKDSGNFFPKEGFRGFHGVNITFFEVRGIEVWLRRAWSKRSPAPFPRLSELAHGLAIHWPIPLQPLE